MAKPWKLGEWPRPAYWRHLAEEHGDCLRLFCSSPAIQPDVCYVQATIAGHFARLFLEQTSLPDLEAPEPGTTCPDCGEYTEVTGFCGVCEERKHPKTLASFLSYAASVEAYGEARGRSARGWPVSAPLPDIEVRDVGELRCAICGDEMRLANFCPTCFEAETQRWEALQEQVRLDLAEAKRRARTWQLDRAVEQ